MSLVCARPCEQPAKNRVDVAAKTVTVGGFTPVTGPVPFYGILTRAADACFVSQPTLSTQIKKINFKI